MNRRGIFSLAWPIALANSAIPLLGLADTAVIGNTGSVADLGAIGLGAILFSFVFWLFGFLRMGTTGFTAQAVGKGDSAEVRAVVVRALLLAGSLGLVLLAMQAPIASFALGLLGATPEVEGLTRSYFDIRIWAAPASLGIFAVLGSLIGMGRTRAVLFLQLFLNGLNILLDIVLAGVLDMGVEGVALGTAIAEWSTLVFALGVAYRTLKLTKSDEERWFPWDRILDRARGLQTLKANSDIMIRTLFLLLGFGWFTNQGAIFGDDILAANHLLLQLVSTSAYLLDGFAHATEILVGRAVGAANLDHFDRSVRLSTQLSALCALALAGGMLLFGPWLVESLTSLPPVREAALGVLPLAGLYVALSFAAFQMDGVFIGATGTRQMRNASALSFGAFLGVSLVLIPLAGNSGLWVAFIGFVVFRAIALWASFPKLRADLV